MGRKKIKITRIADDRNRSVTYLKRKAGLMKKAHELAVLTGSEVAVIVFGQNGKLSEFCSSDMDMLLLRYTEHSGPIERRGPEHYEKDDDDNSDDGAGDDGDDYEGATGTGGGDADESGRTNSHVNSSGRNGSVSGRNQKRKAPGARKDADGQSTSSASSSRRGSSPPSGTGPKITVDGSNAVDDGESIDRDTLKAAIIQRTLSHRPAGIDVSGAAMAQQHVPMPRPAGVQHHHSFSTGDHILLQQQYNAAAMASFTPQRPNTAGSHNSSGLATPVLGLPQRPSPAPFAFTAPGPSPAQAHMFGAPPPMAVSPGGGGGLPPSVGQPSRTHSAMAAPESRMTYGDLARGGGNQGGMVPPTASFALNEGSNHSLMPLAHPILRQHPQFESYQMQLRTQQQSRNSSVPNIHTAPNSPGNLIHGGGQQASQTAGLLATPQSGSLPTIGKRSASFGMATSGNGGGLLQSSFASNVIPSSSGTQMNALQSGEDGAGGFAHDGSTSITAMHGLAPPYGLADTKTSSGAGSTTDTEQPISNADFNELMGSILGDMANTTADGDDSFATLTDAKEEAGGGGGGTAASAAKPRPIPARPTSGTKEEYQTDDLMQSLDSEHSLSTLVNSDSFDGIFKAGVTDVGSTANKQEGVDDSIIHDLSDEALT